MIPVLLAVLAALSFSACDNIVGTRDAPRLTADAGPDQYVAVGDTVRLAGIPKIGIMPAYLNRSFAPEDFTRFEWSFGDGGTSAGAQSSHVYATPGEYTARFHVVDIWNRRASDGVRITVVDPSDSRFAGSRFQLVTVHSLDDPTAVTGATTSEVAVSRDGTVAAIVRRDPMTSIASLTAWRTEDGGLVRAIVQVGDADAIALNPDGSTLAATMRTGGDATIRAWNLADGRVLFGLPAGRPADGSALAFCGTGERLLVSRERDPGTTIEVIRVADGVPLATHRADIARFSQIDLATNGSIIGIANASNRGTVSAWNGTGDAPVFRRGFKAPLTGFAISPNGATVAVGGPGIDLLRSSDGGRIRAIGRREERYDWVSSVAWTPDGAFVVSGEDSRIRVWSTANGQVVRTISTGFAARAVTVTPDGRRIIVVGDGPDSSGGIMLAVCEAS